MYAVARHRTTSDRISACHPSSRHPSHLRLRSRSLMAFYLARSDGGNSVRRNKRPRSRRPAMHPVLRLSEDFLTDRGVVSFPALPRMFFMVRGSAMFGTRSLGPGEACYGEDALTVRVSESGATIWRWELSMGAPAPWRNGPGAISREK